MMTGAANRNSLLKAASLLPLLALTACAGSQRFSGAPFSSGPTYGQPARPSYSEPLPSAPPISSAPVTSEPLPPPGGYPAGSYPSASAPPDGGALPPPGDPFYQPNPPTGAPSTPPPAGAQGGGQVATLGAGSGSGRGAATSRDSVVGNWTAREATGTSCRVQLSSSPSLDLYRANAAGCANRDLQKVNAWDYRNGEVYLYQSGGAVVARLRASDGGVMNGAVTKSGAALSMSR